MESTAQPEHTTTLIAIAAEMARFKNTADCDKSRVALAAWAIRLRDTSNAIRRERDAMKAAIQEAIDLIAFFHGADAWSIYNEHSPEMKRIHAALGRTPHAPTNSEVTK